MAKYTEELVSEIISLIESDIYTVKELCMVARISRETYYQWLDTKPEFKKAVDEAMRQRDEMLVSIARASLRKKLEGYTLEEEKVVYEPAKSNPHVQIEKSRVVKKKQYPPNLAAIKYVLEQEEKRKEKEAAEKPKLRQQIIYVNNQHEADLFIKLDKHLNGEDSQVIRMATEEERERIENDERMRINEK
ncbi:hypothetical protein GGR21_001621 [Dysgonomonas hofstadii]|uniref:Homeodomain phBC6A51-type domain-containing protein n=1 Tax=Dysgonomonas hofstadii TaxID=637886 RepID=A0A840CK32_9BACT|nr:bacteriophage terminase small subunit [Dysgonomonas hofstadii]MBB4035726.1 hypothetical protein [Dysgonomonas hofstadii]